MMGRGVNQRSSEAAGRAAPPKQGALKQQAPSPASPPKLGLEVNEEKGKIQGLVQPREVDGKKLVDLGPLGSMVAPAPGGTDSYLMGLDKLLVLKSKDDGTVEVYTRTLGLEGGNKGKFRGDLLPADGKVELAGKQIEVGHLKPGQERSKKIKIKGKKYEVKLRMNEDGSVTVSGKPKTNFLSKLLGFVGKIAPFLAAVPGLGLVAVAAKVVTGFNAVKNFVNAAKSGNLLGMVSSAAGAVAGFAQGAVQAIASKVANFANVGQQVVDTFKHGLGKGLLQVVSNGANLLSGFARAAGDLGQGGFQKGAYGFAGTAGRVGELAYAADSAGKGNLLPAITQGLQQVASNLGETQKASGSDVKHSVQGGIRFTPFDSSMLPADPLLQSGKFGGFTRSPGLDAFGGSRGSDTLHGGAGSDFLLAKNTFTASQQRLVPNGIQGYSTTNLKNSINALENLGGGGMLTTRHDGRVYKGELEKGLQAINAGLSGGKAGIEKLKQNDGSWKAAFTNEPTTDQLKGYYESVKRTANFLLNNFDDFSSQGGAGDTADHGDVDVLLSAGLLATPAPAPTRGIGERLNDAQQQTVDSIRNKNAAIEASGGIPAGARVLPYQGENYFLTNTRADMNGAIETYETADKRKAIIKLISDSGTETYFQNRQQIFP